MIDETKKKTKFETLEEAARATVNPTVTKITVNYGSIKPEPKKKTEPSAS